MALRRSVVDYDVGGYGNGAAREVLTLFGLLARLLSPRRDDDQWDTFEIRAEVLAVVRTLTSATRVLDVLTLLGGQEGVRFYVTINPGSAFAEGLDGYLGSLRGFTPLSWRDATRRRFDLAVACTVNRSMHQLRAPLLVLPHGVGYNRLVRPTTGDSHSPAGLSRRELTWHGKVIPAAIGVSHPEQIERLRHSCPEAVPFVRLVGDHCFDRMLVSLPVRDRYRRRLGAVDGRKLVVISSTWKKYSLLAQHLDLVRRFVRELPLDEYAVAVVLHPNIWTRHAPEELLGEARQAGLMLIPPQDGWQAALVAADWVIGDHGSVSVYGAALDRVTLLGATGSEELDPRSPTYAFGQNAPRLDAHAPLEPQLRRAAERHRQGDAAALTGLAIGEHERSALLLGEIIFSYLDGIEAPKGEARPSCYPDPVPLATGRPTAYDVVGEVTADGVRIRRYPLDSHDGLPRGLRALTDEENDPRRRPGADVLARTEPRAELAPLDWLSQVLDELPGLVVAVAAVAEDRHLLRLRTGLLLRAETVPAWEAAPDRLDPVVLGAAVTLWLTAHPEADLTGTELVITTGRSHTVRFTAHA
ncbi:hypothetical protein ACFZB9_10635 [Kitasatospora sp. NPDC008050]|uniref:hypothetical protein n=1 Tax=Kitasatospora sp. NPDC008050 TaxID=3364021 RepID=UPI0036E2E847